MEPEAGSAGTPDPAGMLSPVVNPAEAQLASVLVSTTTVKLALASV